MCKVWWKGFDTNLIICQITADVMSGMIFDSQVVQRTLMCTKIFNMAVLTTTLCSLCLVFLGHTKCRLDLNDTAPDELE